MVSPYKVVSPTDSLSEITVLFDGTKITQDNFYSVAYFKWNGHPTLGIRWNGEGEGSKGHPISSFHSSWFVLPDDMHAGVIAGIMKYDLEEGALNKIKEILN